MDTFTKRLIIIVLVVIALVGIAGFVGYRFYNYAIEDASQRIRTGVSEGVQEGVGGMLNPLNLPGKLFGK